MHLKVSVFFQERDIEWHMRVKPFKIPAYLCTKNWWLYYWLTMIVFWTIVQFTSICIIGRIFWRLWSFIWRLLEAASMLKGRGRGHQVHAQGWRHGLHIWALVNLKIRFKQWLFLQHWFIYIKKMTKKELITVHEIKCCTFISATTIWAKKNQGPGSHLKRNY